MSNVASTTVSSYVSAKSPTTPPVSVPPIVIPVIPPAPTATTQESIFRTITKRLSALELNLTLSHRYLEEQSRELNRVFGQVEGQFETLKNRVELDLAQRLEKQQTQTDKLIEEIQQLNIKVHVLADEIMFEKRMGFVQLLLIFAVVVLVGIVYVPVSVWFPTAAGNTAMSWTPMSGQVSVSPFLRARTLSAPASPRSAQSPFESMASPPNSGPSTTNTNTTEPIEIHSPIPTVMKETMPPQEHDSYSDQSDHESSRIARTLQQEVI
ncbi:hypothetical protein BDF19DRAFT_66549 [Syncephalis fuscata]|nr:hypothetical protein BDF19DRAFT_66549 [Syncephalis fuscata]